MATDDTITLSGTPTHDAAGAAANTVIPRRLGHVSLVRELGRGGMGSVWLGRDEMLGRDVAVKFLINAVTDADDPGFARFLEGARAAAVLRHPSLTAIHAAELINGVPYQVMEFVDGPTVAAVLERHGPLEPAVAHAIIGAVADAISTLHERGIVHRDIKPSNVLLDAGGGVFVTDFGLTCRRAMPESKTQVAGTPAYMAPEIFEGSVSPKSDVYALGVMLYEMLTGERPFRGAAGSGTQRIEREAMPRELLTKRNVPEALIEVIERAVHVNPLFRHKSAATFRQAVDDAMKARPDAIRDARAIASLVSRAEGRADAAPPVAKTPGESTPTYFDSLAQIAARKRGALPEFAATSDPEVARVGRPNNDPGAELALRLPEARCVPCVHCAYDLRGQEANGKCPECGEAVSESADPHRLVFSSMEWLRRVTLGISILRISFALVIGIFTLTIASAMMRYFPADAIAKLVGLGMIVAASIGPIAGVWMSTSEEPGKLPGAGDMRRTWVARAAILFHGAYVWLSWKVGQGDSMIVNGTLAFVLGVAYGAGTIHYGRGIAFLLARIPEPKLSRELRSSSVVLGMLLGAAPPMILLRPWMETVSTIVLILVTLSVLVYWGRLGTCERALRRVVKLQLGS